MRKWNGKWENVADDKIIKPDNEKIKKLESTNMRKREKRKCENKIFHISYLRFKISDLRIEILNFRYTIY